MINDQVGDLSSHTTKYTSPVLIQKVFANMKRVGKGFSRVDTPLFDEMLIPQQVHDDVADDVADDVVDDVADVVADGKIAELDADEDVTLEEVAKDLMTEVVTATATIINVALMPKASATRRKKGVVIRDPKETATPSVIVHSEPKSMIKEKEYYDRACQEKGKARQYSHERKPQTEAQVRKNMMVYLKNMVGFKMGFFKGMTYDEIRPIFEKHFNSFVAFLEKGEKELEEEESKQSKRKSKTFKEKAAKKQKLNEEVNELKTQLQIVPNDEDDVYTEATPLALKVHIVDYQIHTKHNKPYYKIIRADGTYQLFLSFNSLLSNFDREDLEMLWKIVQERFPSL
nr:hypothetical protein [Tanacetum cinerariifolium]